eukprot:GHVP01041517.1.p1 GENE.GHVP01041517.1~~GHVP01041517.1.p1  ORF type:complete len:202 (+),score=33.04 GHVP01041517.1:452-1057(+)
MELNPLGIDGKYRLDTSHTLDDTWKAMCALKAKGLCKSVGVSNYNIEELKAMKGEKPACNQVEYHPYLAQVELKRAMEEMGIAMVAYCPLGIRDQWNCNATKDPIVTKIAEKHKVAPGQVVLRWGVQSGHAVVPKTENPNRMKANLDLWGFELDDEDLKEMSKMAVTNRRLINLTYRGGDWVFPRSEADIKAYKETDPTKF